MSLADAEATRARRAAALTPGYYNLALGPTAWRFSSGLGLQFDDNVELTEVNPESDFIFTPSINAQMLWPITDKNSLDLALGLGYSAYVLNPGLSRLYITPGSGLSFNVYSGDFTLNLHDRIAITENAYQDPTVVGNGDYSQLQNAVGLAALWDLNKAVLRAGYDHVNYVALSGGQNTSDGQVETVYGTAGYRAWPTVVTGVELGGGLINYTAADQPDAVQWNAGGFAQALVSDYLRVQGSVGYTVYAPQQSSPSSTASEFSGIYLQLSVAHRISEYLNYTLSGGRAVNLAFYGGTIESYFVNWTASWNVLRKVSASRFPFSVFPQATPHPGLLTWPRPPARYAPNRRHQHLPIPFRQPL